MHVVAQELYMYVYCNLFISNPFFFVSAQLKGPVHMHRMVLGLFLYTFLKHCYNFELLSARVCVLIVIICEG